MKQRIEPFPPDSALPYSHLVPITDLLIRAGNQFQEGGFYLAKDGWRADLKKPIDFQLVENTFDLPKSIILSKDHDSILCQNTWVEIKGGAQRRT